MGNGKCPVCGRSVDTVIAYHGAVVGCRFCCRFCWERPKPAAEYVAKRDVIALLKNYARRCIDAGRLTLDVVDDTAALTCLVEAMPAARYEKEEDDKA